MISWILKQMQPSKNYLEQNLQRFCVEMDPMHSKQCDNDIGTNNSRPTREATTTVGKYN
jgi:hypothetical protein